MRTRLTGFIFALMVALAFVAGITANSWRYTKGMQDAHRTRKRARDEFLSSGITPVCSNAVYEEYSRTLRQAIEEGWEWDQIAMKADHIIEESLDILALMETGTQTNADTVVREDTNAAGRYQIRPIMVDEANRILGETEFTLDDRTDPIRAAMIVKTYLAYWLPRRYGNDFQPQHVPILWYGGTNPRNWGPRTEEYAQRFINIWNIVHEDS